MDKQSLKTINIQGKEYVMVHERIMYFRETFPEYRLLSTIKKMDDEMVLFEAEIINPEGAIVANGHAFERAGSTFINKTSHIENAETSAWGRALASFGIGIEEGMASAEEVTNAQAQQKDKPWLGEKQLNKIIERYNTGEKDIIDKALDMYKMKKTYKEQLEALLKPDMPF